MSGKARIVAFRARTIAGFIVLLTSIGMFLLDAADKWVCSCDIDLQKPAWAFLFLAAYTLLGVNLPALLAGARGRAEADADADEKGA